MGGLGPHLGLGCRERAGHYLTLGERKGIEMSGRNYKIKMETRILLMIQITSRIAGRRS